jgi:hypothetical protein
VGSGTAAATSVQAQMAGRNLLESLYEILLIEDSLINGKIQESLSKCQNAVCNLQRAKHNIVIEFKVGVLCIKSVTLWCVEYCIALIAQLRM